MARSLLQQLFSFQGRMPRAAFWITLLALSGGFVVLFVFLETTLGRPSTLILYPLFFWIAAALSVKRLRDRGRSPAWLLLLLIPILGPLWLFIELMLRRGTPGENQYGPDPLEHSIDYLTVK